MHVARAMKLHFVSFRATSSRSWKRNTVHPPPFPSGLPLPPPRENATARNAVERKLI